jgi:muconolactone delta-isomerase
MPVQFLALLKTRPDTPREKIGPLLKPEATKVWEMLAAGVLRSIHYIDGSQGPVGAALLFEVKDQEAVEAHLKQLPLVEHGLVSVEVLPLSPFTGIATLFAPTTV